MSEACCGMAAEGHGCNCPTMKAETATVQEPDWIPDGDGRAIGQQDFAINLSPLHADTVGSPSPTFNEDITGQDGPSADPTNENFSADGRVHDYKGYDTKMDESLGVRDGKESTKEQSMKDRRDEASAMDKMHSKMGRKYDDVMTMDAESKATFGKDKKGRMYARNRKTGEIITHDADGITGDTPFVPAVKTGAGLVVGMALPSSATSERCWSTRLIKVWTGPHSHCERGPIHTVNGAPFTL